MERFARNRRKTRLAVNGAFVPSGRVGPDAERSAGGDGVLPGRDLTRWTYQMLCVHDYLATRTLRHVATVGGMCVTCGNVLTLNCGSTSTCFPSGCAPAGDPADRLTTLRRSASCLCR